MHKNVYIIGSKGIPAAYGGFETFVEELTGRKKCAGLKYYVSCMNDREERYTYNNAECFNVTTESGGAFGKMLQVCAALRYVLEMVKPNEEFVIYILGCRIGPFLYYYRKKIKEKCPNASIMVNPDGMEWRRSKWKGWQKQFLKLCERCLVKNADCIIADSIGMQEIIEREFGISSEKIIYIAYGAQIPERNMELSVAADWYRDKTIEPLNYYLIVGRFVPENNYEIMIREFMKSKTPKKLVIISNIEKNAFWEELKTRTNFEKDKRIIFAGTVYDRTLLTVIRQNAFAYIHGHEVGGTNPSLLEALAATNINILLDVAFNKEVGEEAVFYFNKQEGNLSKIIDKIEDLSDEERLRMGNMARQRISEKYSWDSVVEKYEKIFIGEE